MAAPFVATGTTITFGTSAFVAKLTSLTPRQSRPDVQTSTMSTANSHTSLPGKLVKRTADIELEFDPAGNPPIDQAAETITITWADGVATPWTISGFMTDFEVTGTLEEWGTARATLVFTGDPSAGF